MTFRKRPWQRLWLALLLCAVTTGVINTHSYLKLAVVEKQVEEDAARREMTADRPASALLPGQTCIPNVLDYDKKKGFPQKEYVFAMQFCSDSTPDPEGRKVDERLLAFNRQLRQFLVLWKSLVLFMGDDGPHLHFAMVVNKDSDFQAGVDLISHWPAQYCNKISFTQHFMQYPEGTEIFKYLNRPCASARFFFPQYFSSPANGPFILSFDTDIIMTSPIQKLWEHFNNFDSNQTFGIASMNAGMPGSVGPERWAKYPKPKHRGLDDGVNIGISLYHMPRWQNLVPDEKKYSQQLITWFKKYGQYFSFPTQDTFNVWLGENPSLYYDLPCEFNVRRTFTEKALALPSTYGAKPRKKDKRLARACPEITSIGAKALHGAGGHFTDNSVGFSDVFDEIEGFNMTNDTLMDLKTRLDGRFQPERLGPHTKTARKVFLRQLFGTIDDIEAKRQKKGEGLGDKKISL
jgi:hypothetical protein